MGGEYYVDENKLSNDEKKNNESYGENYELIFNSNDSKKWHRVLLI